MAMFGGMATIMGLFAALNAEVRDGFLKFRFGFGLIRKKENRSPGLA